MSLSDTLRKLVLIVIASGLLSNTYVSLDILHFLLHRHLLLLLMLSSVFVVVFLLRVVLGWGSGGSGRRLGRNSTSTLLSISLLAGSRRLFKEVLGDNAQDLRFEPLLVGL